jgi:putative hydroxymethylpyrimidine transport system substrate-binding protein
MKVLLLFVCFLFSPFALANSSPPDKLVVMLDWFANPNHAILFVAEQQGFFREQHLAVQLIAPADPTDPPKLVAVGKVDLGVSYEPQLIVQVKEGLPLSKVATLINSPLNCLMASEPIHTLAGLKGKRIGYSTNIDKSLLKIMLASQKLKLSDVTLINVHYNLSQALLSGAVVAVIGVMRNYEPIEMQLAHHPVHLFFPEAYGVPRYDELIIVANTAKLHDSRLPRFLQALRLGAKYLAKHPQESWALFAKNHPELNNELNRRAWFATLPLFAKYTSKN